MSLETVSSSKQKFSFSEDSLALKIFTAVPVFGLIPRSFAIPKLDQKINRVLNRDVFTDNEKVIQLVQIKNDYLTADIARNLLTTAFLIIGLAMGLFTGGIFIAVIVGLAIGLSLVNASICIEKAAHNKAAIEEIRETGIRSGLEIL